MPVDHAGGADTSAETVEQQRRVEAPPPPPDRPGAEGAPSRAESRAAAAAPADSSPQQTENTVERPDTSPRHRSDTSAASEKLDGPSDDGASTANDEPRDQVGAANPPEQRNSVTSEATSSEIPNDAGNERTQTSTDSPGERGLPDNQLTNNGTQADEHPEPNGQTDPQDATATDGTGEDRASASPGLEEHQRTDATITGESTERTAATADNTDQPAADQAEAEAVTAAEEDPGNAGQTDLANDAHGINLNADDRDHDTEGLSDEPPPETEQPDAHDPAARDSNPSPEARPDDEPHIPVPADRSARLGQTAEGDEVADDAEVVPPDDADRAVADGLEEPTGDRPESAPEGRAEVENDSEPDRGQNQSADEAPDWTDGVERLTDLPIGEDLRDMENDRLSRRERVRREGHRQASDVLDVVKQDVNTVNELLKKPPPTGHPETSTGPEMAPAPHEGASAGDLATGVLVFGMLVGEAGRWLHGKVKRRRGA